MKAVYHLVHLAHVGHCKNVIVQCTYLIEHLLHVCYPLPQILVDLFENSSLLMCLNAF